MFTILDVYVIHTISTPVCCTLKVRLLCTECDQRCKKFPIFKEKKKELILVTFFLFFFGSLVLLFSTEKIIIVIPDHTPIPSPT